MNLRDVRLSDRYDLDCETVLLSGTQALVRLALIQRARDKAAGLNTAGCVTGYRGSPLGAVDGVFAAAGRELAEARVRFHPGLNEDLAATALWGAQQAEIRGEGLFDGVFGLWYGKGPGVDRCGDVFRHANLAGASRHGGVLVAMGDDHTGESSTTLHQSEMAMMDAYIPVLSPAGVQEILDFGVLGWAMSRYSGCWVGLKCVKDTVEATSVVDGRWNRIELRAPPDPAEGLNILRAFEDPHVQEERLHDLKRPAVLAFARANGLDRRGLGGPGARIGIAAAGKSYMDVRHALDLLGVDAATADRIGLTTYKIGMVWPLEPEGLTDWSEGLETVIVVEEKRPILETQIKEILFDRPDRPRVIGHRDETGRVLFSVKKGLDPATIARGIAGRLIAGGRADDGIRARLARLDEVVSIDDEPEIVRRTPWFCAGCPHSAGTKLPEGARAYSGIGCHYMVQWMDRETAGYTHMGGEGANWIGEAPFSTRGHVFQNLGDGTYNHSGIMAIRAAVGAGVNMTYKILYNDAVAMTGGQRHDGGVDARRIVEELIGVGVGRVEVVIDEKEKEDAPAMPPGVRVRPRADLIAVERELQEVEGVTAIVYIQTCAAEKRRRRKRGLFPDPDRRVFINPSVCEGCGDCGARSNCVAVLPLETPFGRKREIDQSACNKDFSCLEGFCPSFVTVEGATLKTRTALEFDLPDLPSPELPTPDRPWNVLIVGVGGSGVVTVGALLTMAAHIEGKGAAEMQMAGLAQKGGAVTIHCRIAPSARDISAIRIASGEADAVIGGDLVVAAAPETLSLMRRGTSRVVCNMQRIVTGAFTHDTEFSLPMDRLKSAVERRVGAEAVSTVEATKLAVRFLGDAIYANVMMLGAAWQAGAIPLSAAAIRRAIELNGAAVAGNLRAFQIGRWAVAVPGAALAAVGGEAAGGETDEEMFARCEGHLAAYQDAAYAARWRALVDRAMAVDAALGRAVAEGYVKVLAYKDEYEVARLHTETLDRALAETFDKAGRVTFHFAPPIFGRKDGEGRPKKIGFGPWIRPVLRGLAGLKRLRGARWDVFGYTEERRAERRAITDYEALVEELLTAAPKALPTAVALARLPLKVRGFGHVKARNAAAAAEERAALLAEFRAGGSAPRPMAAE